MPYSDKDLTDVIIFLEEEKKKAAKEMDLIYHMIWVYRRQDQYNLWVFHTEKRDVGVDEIFMMFPEISPAFFKHFDVEEITFRFKGGTVTLKRKES